MVTFFQTLQSFSQFIMNFILSGGVVVDQNTANIRAEICSKSHNNQPSGDVRKGGCGVCNKTGNKVLEGFRTKIISNNSTPFDDRLLACAICGCDLRISVWIPNKVLLTKEQANAYPDYCWKKKILVDQDV